MTINLSKHRGRQLEPGPEPFLSSCSQAALTMGKAESVWDQGGSSGSGRLGSGSPGSYQRCSQKSDSTQNGRMRRSLLQDISGGV